MIWSGIAKRPEIDRIPIREASGLTESEGRGYFNPQSRHRWDLRFKSVVRLELLQKPSSVEGHFLHAAGGSRAVEGVK